MKGIGILIAVFCFLQVGAQIPKRNFPVELKLEKVCLIDEPCEIEEFRTKGDYFLCRDITRQKILVFTKDFKLVKTYGGKGKGPGEFIHISAFDAVGDTLWGLDMGRKRLITVVGNKEIHAEDISGNLWYGSIFQGNVMYNVNEGLDDMFFYFRSRDGKLEKKWNVADLLSLKKKEGATYVYNGNTCTDDNYGIYYSICAPYFFCFDKNGLKYAKRSIIPIDPPEGKNIITKTMQTVELSHEYSLHYTGCIYNKELFLLTKVQIKGVDDKQFLNVDVYNVENGDYKYSMKVPASVDSSFKAIGIAADEDYFYVYYENSEMYKFKKERKS